MPLEIELKFSITDADHILAQLAPLGLTDEGSIDQVDIYYNHPGRDFATTDEALRIRRTGQSSYLTYKGPLLDPLTKSRREYEAHLAEGQPTFDTMAAILSNLGFTAVREVAKTRHRYTFTWEGRPFELCLDDVKGLGHYIELETVSDDESHATQSSTRESLLRLAKTLGLASSERRSYLRLLIEKESISA